MKKTILVAGGTGNLGMRIIRSLIARGAAVRAIVRSETKQEKIKALEDMGAQVISVAMHDKEALQQACTGVHCVVSALAGLEDVIVDAQSQLLDAAVAAGVPRFIPSDFSSDFTGLAEGENRNFDLRRKFHERLDSANIAGTAIMNGAFANILAYNTPFYNLKDQTVSYWGDKADWKVDFTTMDNTADYTAAAALDDSTPEVLRIASFQVTAKEMADMGSEVKQTPFQLKQMGTLEELSAYNKQQRAANPEGEQELYPRWQASQYLHSMFSVQNKVLDNDRYTDVVWTPAIDVVSKL